MPNACPKPERMKKKKVNKKIGVQSLKKELDFIFSWHIRLKDASQDGKVACYTCYKIFDVIEIQAGHYWVFGSKGKPQEFAAHLVNEYGGEHLNQLEEMKKVSVHWKPYMLQEKIDYYAGFVSGFMKLHPNIKISKKLEKYLKDKNEN
jgi:hypothetical protein